MPRDGSVEAVRKRLGYASTAELVLHLPLRYEDETRLTPIAAARAGETVTVEGVIVQAAVHTRPRRQLVVELVEAAPESPRARMFFRLLHFHPGQVAQLRPGVRVRLHGQVRPGFFGDEMVHPRYRLVRADTPLPRTLTPVYPSVAGIGQTTIRRAVEAALADADLADTLPQDLLARLGLPGYAEAVRLLHHPPPGSDLAALSARTHPAWRRLKFDELLAQQLSLRRHARARARLAAPSLTGGDLLAQRLLAGLPFQPTGAQLRAWAEIRADLARSRPMHRLLQGDVGSGKTLVAALACLPAVADGWQVAVMAPTEILAEQLYGKLREWLAALGVRVVWLAAAVKGRQRRAVLTQIAAGEAQVAVGTHALIQDEVRFARLALAIVDEQHRFGVEQRLTLRAKGINPHPNALTPHLLMMSATPIPRSLAMSYYADLDVSTLDELPPGRRPVITKLIGQHRRAEVIARLRDYCAGGAQAYWVCPLVEESDRLQLKAAEATYAELVQALPGLRVGLIHGRLKAAQKAAVMQAFKSGEIDLLVATTVIEVGVDVPNAALMVIEHAERMGLAQLHQLRGRVGRGGRESVCILLYGEPLGAQARQRLRVLRASQDGFSIAREDLRLRGPGEFTGARQAGLPTLRFANPELDVDLLQTARVVAERLLNTGDAAVERHLARWLPRGLEFLQG
ncbi:MAG: ATP-dependent DNA helicase RecG [Thiobacillaceae bacterium]|nr:ATP-dependent DNA helicase RecG [Thiobacillaceae bacterium]